MRAVTGDHPSNEGFCRGHRFGSTPSYSVRRRDMKGSRCGRSKFRIGTSAGSRGGGGSRFLLCASSESSGSRVGGAVVRNVPAKADGTSDDLNSRLWLKTSQTRKQCTDDQKRHANNPDPAGHARSATLSLPEPHTGMPQSAIAVPPAIMSHTFASGWREWPCLPSQPC